MVTDRQSNADGYTFGQPQHGPRLVEVSAEGFFAQYRDPPVGRRLDQSVLPGGFRAYDGRFCPLEALLFGGEERDTGVLRSATPRTGVDVEDSHHLDVVAGDEMGKVGRRVHVARSDHGHR